jgi:hypothetical protein
MTVTPLKLPETPRPALPNPTINAEHTAAPDVRRACPPE